jgi:U3 small nucleolar RNA-associated protein 7
MVAVAVPKLVYIYDSHGTQLHCLRNHLQVTLMVLMKFLIDLLTFLLKDFLPYHFLLVTAGKTGYLKYQVRLRVQK